MGRGFGYAVSLKTRRAEIEEADRVVSNYDTLIRLFKAGDLTFDGVSRSETSHGDCADVAELVFQSREVAAAFGFREADVVNIAAANEIEGRVDDWIDFDSIESYDWQAGRDGYARVEGLFNMRTIPTDPAKWKRDRAGYVSSRARARRAIRNGHAR
jgi:hypothetical protein